MLMLVYSLGVFGVLCWAESEVICSLSPVLLYKPIFSVVVAWLLHGSCGPRWGEMSQAGSEQQRGALILNVGHGASTNTLLKDFLRLCLAWLCSSAGRSKWVLNALRVLFLSRSHILPVKLAWKQRNERFHLPPAVIFTCTSPAISFFYLFLLRSPCRHFLLNNLLLDFGFLLYSRCTVIMEPWTSKTEDTFYWFL